MTRSLCIAFGYVALIGGFVSHHACFFFVALVLFIVPLLLMLED